MKSSWCRLLLAFCMSQHFIIMSTLILTFFGRKKAYAFHTSHHLTGHLHIFCCVTHLMTFTKWNKAQNNALPCKSWMNGAGKSAKLSGKNKIQINDWLWPDFNEYLPQMEFGDGQNSDVQMTHNWWTSILRLRKIVIFQTTIIQSMMIQQRERETGQSFRSTKRFHLYALEYTKNPNN